jgi:hypothetical protein
VALTDYQKELAEKQRQTAINLLKKELQAGGINVNSFLPTWVKSREVREAILEELLVALDAHVHEGLIPPYGSIVVPKDQKLDRLIPIDESALPLARKAADGSSGLLVLEEGKPTGLMLVDPANAPDLELARLARVMDAVAFRRGRSGVLRAYSLEGALRYSGRHWSKSPPIYEAQQTVLKAAPMLDRAKLAHVLEFAYYVLSPWYIGATLVWILDDKDPFVGQGIDLQPLGLSVEPKDGSPSVAFAAHLLAQHDGATVLDAQGRIVRTGIQLSASASATKFVPPYSGTRHTSARRASFDLPNAMIVTVSADGPVTIFSDGLSVLELWFASAEREAHVMNQIRRDAGVEPGAWTSYDQALCKNCGKTSNIEIVTLPGWRDDESADCPVCGATVAQARCWNIYANIVKVL